jgi:hypothetical protein
MRIEPIAKDLRPDLTQERHVKPHGMPELVNAGTPSH